MVHCLLPSPKIGEEKEKRERGLACGIPGTVGRHRVPCTHTVPGTLEMERKSFSFLSSPLACHLSSFSFSSSAECHLLLLHSRADLLLLHIQRGETLLSLFSLSLSLSLSLSPSLGPLSGYNALWACCGFPAPSSVKKQLCVAHPTVLLPLSLLLLLLLLSLLPGCCCYSIELQGWLAWGPSVGFHSHTREGNPLFALSLSTHSPRSRFR